MILIKSILAGIFIAIASYIYLQIGGIAGAFLFSIGLLVILNMKYKLFTGTVGYIENKKDIKDNLIILIGNILGTFIILNFPILNSTIAISATKLSYPSLLLFNKAIICGMFIYTAVYSFKQKKDYMVVAMVTGFILFGGEHCIADLCFFLAGRIISFQAIKLLFIVTLGNAVGAIILNQIEKKGN